MVRRSASFSLFLMITAAGGCGPSQSGPVVRPSRPEDVVVETKTSTPNVEVSTPGTEASGSSTTESAISKGDFKLLELLETNWAGLQSLIGEQRGKVVVVDVWSTACEPCMTEFPHLIALQNRFPETVVAISFDIDYAGIKNKSVGYYRDRVLNFLASQPASKALHRMSTTAADDLFTEAGLDSIPAVYVYGRDGNLAQKFEGSNSQGTGVSYESQVIPFVEQLLK